jgi:hypothetical protein
VEKTLDLSSQKYKLEEVAICEEIEEIISS